MNAGGRLEYGERIDLPGRGKIFVRDIPGPPGASTVVLIHGWMATADLNWYTSYDALAAHHRVIAVDNRGHGLGIKPKGRFRLADCADDVAAVCDHLGVERFVPVGYSMGGPIALLTWHRHRHRVAGLVLCATAPYFANQDTRQYFQVMSLAGSAARLAPKSVRRRLTKEIASRRAAGSPMADWVTEEISRSDPAALADAGGALGRFDARPWLGDITVPTVVVRTTQDSVVPPSRQTLLAQEIPTARMVDVHADHLACVTGWEQFVPALTSATRYVTEVQPTR